MKHKLTHLPKNPYCDACSRGKMKQKFAKRCAFKRSVEEWGDIVTADHMDTVHIKAQGINGEQEAFVIKDLYSGLLHGFPHLTKHEEWVEAGIRNFAGKREINLFYSDGGAEFKAAAKAIKLAHERSTPGIHSNNAIIERANQLLTGGVATTLLQAGLPHVFWPYAMECWCLHRNIMQDEDGQSSWGLTRGTEFPGKTFPFGCLVNFKPSPTRDSTLKFGAKGHLGVFAGYSLTPGYQWSGDYLVWELTAFRGADLRDSATRLHQRMAAPRVTKVVELAENKVTFPLKERYDKVNRDTEDPDLGPDPFNAVTTDEQRRKRAGIDESADGNRGTGSGVMPGLGDPELRGTTRNQGTRRDGEARSGVMLGLVDPERRDSEEPNPNSVDDTGVRIGALGSVPTRVQTPAPKTIHKGRRTPERRKATSRPRHRRSGHRHRRHNAAVDHFHRRQASHGTRRQA